MAEQWLSISEYARRYNLSDMTVRRRIKNGRIHAVLKDGKYFIPAANDSRNSHAVMQDEEVYERPRHQHQKSHPTHHDQSHLYRAPAQTTQSSGNAVHHVQNSQIQLIKGQQNHTQHQHYAPPPTATQAPVSQPRLNTDHLERQLSNLEQKLDNALQMLGQVEAMCAAKYEARIKSLESDLKFKEREVKELLQQNEDLKLLLKFVEKKVPSIGAEKNQRL